METIEIKEDSVDEDVTLLMQQSGDPSKGSYSHLCVKEHYSSDELIYPCHQM